MMLMPSIFGENLFDDFMSGFPYLSTRKYFDMPAQSMMRTDVKDTGSDYELSIDLPGYKKEDVKAQLKDGYLTISAATEKNEDEKDENGKYLRKERYTGSVSRSYYVGENLQEEDIHARFDNGILTLPFPKEAPKKIEEEKYISIEG